MIKDKIYNNMKHLKYFENIQKKPQVGDYVICEEEAFTNDLLIEFINSNIGRVFFINYKDDFPYAIKYENVPNEIDHFFGGDDNDYCRSMSETEIKFFSPNKDDLELIIRANKYNL